MQIAPGRLSNLCLSPHLALIGLDAVLPGCMNVLLTDSRSLSNYEGLAPSSGVLTQSKSATTAPGTAVDSFATAIGAVQCGAR